jgi:hypothetical protein
MFRTKDPAKHAEALGRPSAGDVHEFYSPFTMVDDLVELVRVISPGYGEMDMAVLIYQKPLHIYVNSHAGERFLRERFPRVRRHRVSPSGFRLDETDRGHTIIAQLTSGEGPLRALSLVVHARAGAEPVVERYESEGVWMSDKICHGIDMRLAATAKGMVRRAGEKPQAVDQAATLFRGSYGRITERAAKAVRPPRTR